MPRNTPVDFANVNKLAMVVILDLLRRWLPHGRREGNEWVALNPRRADRHLGSFRVNLHTGAWADFAIADAKGGDAISLCAYLHGITQLEAARLEHFHLEHP